MDLNKKFFCTILFVALFTILVSPGYSAYGTLGKITVSVPSSISPSVPTQVDATVYTDVSG
jgi:hypothetical protein